ncbi:MAG TPA: transcriptional regulator NrdR [Acidimicrobiales bacterium]|nr:transcriptional regulator NrdR [Acidimicrobiales bacterium]
MAATGPRRQGAGGSLGRVRCPHCLADDDRVVDSRIAEDGAAIRRRRECAGCGHRYTTFERIEEVPLSVVKRSGLREPFERGKVIDGLRAATKNRPVTESVLETVARDVEDELREAGPVATSEEVGLAVLDRLRAVDEVAYLRFASVYKGFEGAEDFRREVGLLKTTAPKQPAATRGRSGSG